jgi:hypothetical protein
MGNVESGIALNCGLTDDDRSEIASGVPFLFDQWKICFETVDDGACYACLFAPWDEKIPSFLIDRCGHALILTDRLTSPIEDRVDEYESVQDTLLAVQRLINGPEQKLNSDIDRDYLEIIQK